MRRKDGKPQIRALRNKPKFEVGFRDSDNARRNRYGEEEGPFKVMSFFSGCGGLDFGFRGGFSVLGRSYEPLPFDIVGAYDFLQDSVDCYKLNVDNRIQHADLTKVDIDELPGTDVLIGGFPCQDFSSSGPKTGFDGKRGRLYQVLRNYMNAHRPRVVVGENVIHLARMREGEVLRTIVRDFESVGYHFDVWNLYAPDYGVPQSRRRLIFVGVRNDIDGFPVKPAPTNFNNPVTISEALKDLEDITDETVTNQSQYFVASKATSGGGQGDTVNEPDKVALCIRANSRGRIQFHYKLPRRLTVRECARVQTFPDEFVFPYTTQRNLTLIGNAVPPILAHSVAKSVARFMEAIDHGVNVGHAITTQREYKPIDNKGFVQGEFGF
ncbi:MAG: DNA cytosine methyltransferase [Kiritimatiellia bacterium]